MAKSARYRTPAPETGTANYVARSLTSRGRAWIPLTAKFAVFFAVWIGAAYFLNGYVTSEAWAQLAAVAFWFGWLFAGAILLGVLAMILTGVVHDLRHPVK